jgi:hypothetical protein
LSRKTRASGRGPLHAAGLIAVMAATACSGSGEGLDENGRPVGETPPPPPDGETALFSQIQESVFAAFCIQCHQGAAAPLGLRLDGGNSYAMLVGVASAQVPVLLRVEPGAPADSYLVRKLEGNAAVGGRMPLGGPPLPAASLDLVREWIAAGALPPEPAAGRSALAVLSTVPAEGERTPGPLHAVTLVTDGAVDASLAVSGTLKLETLDGGGRAAELALESVKVSLANPRVVTLTPLRPLAPGRYRLKARGEGSPALADVGGTRLDGDGDGRPGGDLAVDFAVVPQGDDR